MAITTAQDEEYILASIRAGVTGFVQREEIDGSELAENLRVLHAGASPVPPMIARHLIRFLAMSFPHMAGSSAHA